MATPPGRFVTEDPWRVFRIMAEFVESFETLSQVGPAVTIFGSARTKPSDKYYKATVRIARQLAEHNFAVITGGGPGIMEAANKGAREGGGKSVGLNIQLPFEQSGNTHANISINYHYFFARKVCLAKYSSAFIYMPGGFGTLDEFFEILTLVQTQRMPKFPMILFGKKFWSGLLRWTEGTMKAGKFISPDDKHLFTVTDSESEVIEIITEWQRKRDGQPQTVAAAYL